MSFLTIFRVNSNVVVFSILQHSKIWIVMKSTWSLKYSTYFCSAYYVLWFKECFPQSKPSYAYTQRLLKKLINVFLLGKFIQWMIQTYTDETPVYLGGANTDDMTTCYNLSRANFEVYVDVWKWTRGSLWWYFFHVNHGVKRDHVTKIVTATTDTDVFVNAVHHFSKWKYEDLKELMGHFWKSWFEASVPCS